MSIAAVARGLPDMTPTYIDPALGACLVAGAWLLLITLTGINAHRIGRRELTTTRKASK